MLLDKALARLFLNRGRHNWELPIFKGPKVVVEILLGYTNPYWPLRGLGMNAALYRVVESRHSRPFLIGRVL